MQVNRFESQRGQTLPFWVIGILVVLSMVFVLANYANAVAWQIRAQSAADAAASGVLSVQANVYNEYSTILYSTAVDEYRVRTLNQALLNTIYGIDCTTAPGGTCEQNYNSLASAYDSAVSAFTDDIHLLDQANNMTQAGQTTDQSKALTKINNGTQCSTSNDYACSFYFNVLDASSTAPSNNGNNGGYIVGGDNEVDLVACKNVGYFASGLFPSITGATYKVLGRAAAAVVPAYTEDFNPGSSTNPQSGQPYQPTEKSWATGYSDVAYWVDFSGLDVHLKWYQAGTIKPYSTITGSLTCK